MRIALFGATGFTGKIVLQQALDAEHEVYALVRNPNRVDIQHDKLTLAKGDALNRADVRNVLKQSDVVLHCLGVGGKGNGQPTTLVSDSVKLVIEGMQELHMKRIICMSNIGAGGSGTWFANKIVIPLFVRWLKPLIEDKDRMEEALMKSGLEWQSVRLPNIVEGEAKPIQESQDGKGLSLRITTQSVANYLLRQLSAAEITYATPSISN